MSANMWCALYISQSMGDLMTFYPNLGETHFHVVFDTLEKLLTRSKSLHFSSIVILHRKDIRPLMFEALCV